MDFDKIVSRLKESLDYNFEGREKEKVWYKDGILNCADAFITCMRDERTLSDEEIARAIHKFGGL